MARPKMVENGARHKGIETNASAMPPNLSSAAFDLDLCHPDRHKLDCLTIFPREPLVPIGINIGSFVSKCRIPTFGNKRKNGRTDERTDRLKIL